MSDRRSNAVRYVLYLLLVRTHTKFGIKIFEFDFVIGGQKSAVACSIHVSNSQTKNSRIQGQRFGTSKMHLSPSVALAAVCSKAVVLLLLIVIPIVGFCNCSMFCCALLCVHSCFAIILMEKRELVVLLCLSSWCLVIVVWLFRTMPQVCLPFVIVVLPDHTHYFWLDFVQWFKRR